MSKEIETDADLQNIEECPNCGYTGVYYEEVQEDLTLMICPICKNSYHVDRDIDGE